MAITGAHSSRTPPWTEGGIDQPACFQREYQSSEASGGLAVARLLARCLSEPSAGNAEAAGVFGYVPRDEPIEIADCLLALQAATQHRGTAGFDSLKAPEHREVRASTFRAAATSPVVRSWCELLYWVTFDTPQYDSGGGRPFRKAQVGGRYLRSYANPETAARDAGGATARQTRSRTWTFGVRGGGPRLVICSGQGVRDRGERHPPGLGPARSPHRDGRPGPLHLSPRTASGAGLRRGAWARTLSHGRRGPLTCCRVNGWQRPS